MGKKKREHIVFDGMREIKKRISFTNNNRETIRWAVENVHKGKKNNSK